MAGPTIANAEVDVDLDGDRLSAQARRIATRAADGFGRSFQQRLDRSGLGRTIPRLLAGSIGGGGDAGRRLAESFSESFRITILRNLDNDVRLIIGLLVALAPQIAALGSGLSAALVGQLSTALVGLGGALLTVGGPATALALSVAMLASEWEDLLERNQALSTAVDNLSGAWSEQSAIMADLAARGIGPLIDSLATAIGNSNIGAGLGRAISEIAVAFDQVVGSSAFNQFLTALESTFPQALSLFGQSIAQITQALLQLFASAGPAAVQLGEAFLSWSTSFAAAMDRMAASGQLSAFFDQAVVSVQALMGFILPLTQALGNVFLLGTASGDRMLGTLGELAQQFLAFTQSVEGSQAITDWFANGEQVFNALLPLIGALGTMLADLVTAETINQVVSFLGAMTELVPIIGQVLSVIGELNLLNLVTQALIGIGQALQPVLPLLSSLASAIGNVDPGLIQGIAVGFAALFAAARGVGALLGLNNLLLLLTGGSTGLAGALRIVGVALRGLFAVMLTNPIGLVITAIAALVAGLVYFFTQTETGRAAWASFVSWLQDLWAGLSEWFTGTFLPAMTAVWDGLVAGVQGIGSFFVDAWNGLINAPQALVDWFTGTLVPFFQNLPQLIGAGIEIIGQVFQNAFQSALDWLTGTFLPFIAGIPGAIASGLGAAVGFFLGLPGQIIGALANLTTFWLTFWANLFTTAINFISTGITNIITFFTGLPAQIQSLWASFTAWWAAFWPALWTTAISAIASGIGSIVAWFTNLVDNVTIIVNYLRANFPAILGQMMGRAVAAVASEVTREIPRESRFENHEITLFTPLCTAATARPIICPRIAGKLARR